MQNPQLPHRHSVLRPLGVIRGEKPSVLSETLQFALSAGMQLHFVARRDYNDKEGIIEELRNTHDNFYVIPEGGTNIPALKGVEEMMEETGMNFDYFCAPVGTGIH